MESEHRAHHPPAGSPLALREGGGRTICMCETSAACQRWQMTVSSLSLQRAKGQMAPMSGRRRYVHMCESHTPTLDSVIRCCHGRHSRDLVLVRVALKKRRKKYWMFFFSFCLLHVLFFSFFFLNSQFATRSQRSKQHNGVVQSEGQCLRGAEEAWTLLSGMRTEK